MLGPPNTDYSETELTRPSDKLPAIAGLISHIQQQVKSDHSFGHWTQPMPQELLWRAAHPGITVAGRAPSWSWASIDPARIYNDFGVFYERLTRFKHAEMVKRPLKTSAVRRSESLAYDASHAVEIRVHILKGTLESNKRDESRFMVRLLRSTDEPRLHFYPDSTTKVSNGTDLFCVLMSSGIRIPDRLTKVKCIMLAVDKKALKKDPICYSRVGYAVQHGDETCRKIINLFRENPAEHIQIL